MMLYAVMENNFQYDDNNYYIGEGDVGKVTKLYRDRIRAEEICFENIVEFFEENYTFSSFGYEINDVFEIGWGKALIEDENEEKTADVLEYQPDGDKIMEMDNKSIPDFIRKNPKIISYLKNPPFYVQELEVDE